MSPAWLEAADDWAARREALGLKSEGDFKVGELQKQTRSMGHALS